MPNPIHLRKLGPFPSSQLGANFVSASTQYASIADTAALSMGAVDMTIAFWVIFNSVGTLQAMVSKYQDTGAQREYYFEIHAADNKIYFGLYSNGITLSEIAANTFGALSAGVPYFVCGRLDNGNNVQSISINAGSIDTVSYTNDIFDGTAPFEVSGLNNGTAELGNCTIGRVGVWKSAVGGGGFLSDAQLAQLYRNGVGMLYKDLYQPLKTSLVAYYDLNGDFKDKHGGNDLTPTNNPTFILMKNGHI